MAQSKNKTSFVIRPEVQQMMVRIGATLGLSKSGVVDLAVRMMARRMRIR